MLTRDELNSIYERFDRSNAHYIIGYYEHGRVYMAFTVGWHYNRLATLQRSSSSTGNGSSSLRMPRQTADIVRAIKTHAVKTIDLMSVEELDAMADSISTKQHNLGKGYEKAVTEFFGQEWKSDTVPWWAGPDIVINGTGWQIKYARCSFCNEGQMKRQGWA